MLKSYHWIQQAGMAMSRVPAAQDAAYAKEAEMKSMRRLMLTGGAAGMAAAAAAAAAESPRPADDLRTGVEEVIRLSETSNAALMRGDIHTYRQLITFSDDFSFMSPFGGEPTHRASLTEESIDAIGRFFRNGTFIQEVVQTYASADLVVLALIERSTVEAGGLPAQEWPLRVTLVYRRVGSQWQLAHRHADPLVEAIGLEEAAALARGKRR